MTSDPNLPRHQKIRRGFEYLLARIPGIRRFYWNIAPKYYRWWFRRRLDHDAPLDPLKIVWVDPDRISTFSGRNNARHHRWRDIATVRGGNWDQQPPSGYTDVDKFKNVHTSKSIEKTVLYQSFRSHYENDVPWEDTELYQIFASVIEDGSIQSSKEDVLADLQQVDCIYNDIKTEGYKSQSELIDIKSISQNCIGYLNILTNEITVDIDRSGDPLFVDGRHRLCISKILGLEAIPVFILTRHGKWMEKRSEIYSKNKNKIRSNMIDIEEFQ